MNTNANVTLFNQLHLVKDVFFYAFMLFLLDIKPYSIC